MAYLLQIDFPYEGPWGDDMASAMRELAESINQEPGLLWKVWTENPENHEAGGIYLFSDKASAEKYFQKHLARLDAMGVSQVFAKLFTVNEALSKLNRASLGA